MLLYTYDYTYDTSRSKLGNIEDFAAFFYTRDVAHNALEICSIYLKPRDEHGYRSLLAKPNTATTAADFILVLQSTSLENHGPFLNMSRTVI